MKKTRIITAGSTYLDIDAYACCVALAELLALRGERVVAYSAAPCNYSVCPSLRVHGQIQDMLPVDFRLCPAKYIIVDVSDPDYLKDSVPLEQVVEVYDHHVGFEDYWHSRIGDNAHIEFIGAAATLIYRQWKAAGLERQISAQSARLLVAAILDNTLDLTSSNTTDEDRRAFQELCAIAGIDPAWRAEYFAEVQSLVEADLKNALLGDIKTLREHPILPHRIAQLCVWDAEGILAHLPRIRGWFSGSRESWMINIIDIQKRCSYFVCQEPRCQRDLEEIFHVRFHCGVARAPVSYLRKEIIKKTQNIRRN